MPAHRHTLAAFGAAVSLACTAAQAGPVALPADGSWQEFTVDNLVGPSYGSDWIDFADGSALQFDFTIAAGFVGLLTVVDSGFAGDSFVVRNGSLVLGTTSSVPTGTTAGNLVFDFDEALADPAYSRGVFTLAAGDYSIGGSLLQSVFDDAGAPLNATSGGLRLTTTALAVPEPASLALTLAALGMLGASSSSSRRGRRG